MTKVTVSWIDRHNLKCELDGESVITDARYVITLDRSTDELSFNEQPEQPGIRPLSPAWEKTVRSALAPDYVTHLVTEGPTMLVTFDPRFPEEMEVFYENHFRALIESNPEHRQSPARRSWDQLAVPPPPITTKSANLQLHHWVEGQSRRQRPRRGVVGRNGLR